MASLSRLSPVLFLMTVCIAHAAAAKAAGLPAGTTSAAGARQCMAFTASGTAELFKNTTRASSRLSGTHDLILWGLLSSDSQRLCERSLGDLLPTMA